MIPSSVLGMIKSRRGAAEWRTEAEIGARLCETSESHFDPWYERFITFYSHFLAVFVFRR